MRGLPVLFIIAGLSIVVPSEATVTADRVKAIRVNDSQHDGMVIPVDGKEISPNPEDLLLVENVTSQISGGGKSNEIYGQLPKSAKIRSILVSTYVFDGWIVSHGSNYAAEPRAVPVLEIKKMLAGCSITRHSLLPEAGSSPGARFIMVQWACHDSKGKVFALYSSVKVANGAAWTFYLTINEDVTVYGLKNNG